MAERPQITFEPLTATPKNQTRIFFMTQDGGMEGALKAINERSGGMIAKAAEVTEFKAKRKSALEVLAPQGVEAGRVLVVGLGKTPPESAKDWLEIGGAVRGKLHGKAIEADIIFDEAASAGKEAILAFAEGLVLRSYSFKKYKTKPKAEGDNDENSASQESEAKLAIFSSFGTSLDAPFRDHAALCDGVYFARDLVNEPANILTPKEFADRLRALEREGLSVEVLDAAAMTALGMRALLAVGQGSAQPSYAVVLRWNGAPENGAKAEGKRPVFIGKGVCFDTGGISIKPAAGMEDMKGDMGGAAAVAGLMLALAKSHAPVNAVGIVGLVENMPSGTAQRPGDVITAASGQTIEVLNTDAEGRLVLADLLWYAQKYLNPSYMITLATLTGAIIVALGKEHAGLFSNDDELAKAVTEAGVETGELVWRLPLSKKYDKLIESKVADIKNIGGRDAGSITAAQFLQRFVENGARWAHLDIAGTAMAAPTTDINHSWGSGYGVRLLERLVSKPDKS